MNSLSDEVVLYIMSYFNFKDLLALSSTCSRLRQLCSEDCIWKGLYKRDFYLEGYKRLRKKAGLLRESNAIVQRQKRREKLLSQNIRRPSKALPLNPSSSLPTILEDLSQKYELWKHVYKETYYDPWMEKKKGSCGSFRRNYSLARRIKLSELVMELYFQSVLVIVEPKLNVVESWMGIKIDSSVTNKWVVLSNVTFSKLASSVRKVYSLNEEEKYELFIGHYKPWKDDLMSHLYENHKDQDNILYIGYMKSPRETLLQLHEKFLFLWWTFVVLLFLLIYSVARS